MIKTYGTAASAPLRPAPTARPIVWALWSVPLRPGPTGMSARARTAAHPLPGPRLPPPSGWS